MAGGVEKAVDIPHNRLGSPALHGIFMTSTRRVGKTGLRSEGRGRLQRFGRNARRPQGAQNRSKYASPSAPTRGARERAARSRNLSMHIGALGLKVIVQRRTIPARPERRAVRSSMIVTARFVPPHVPNGARTAPEQRSCIARPPRERRAIGSRADFIRHDACRRRGSKENAAAVHTTRGETRTCPARRSCAPARAPTPPPQIATTSKRRGRRATPRNAPRNTDCSTESPRACPHPRRAVQGLSLEAPHGTPRLDRRAQDTVCICPAVPDTPAAAIPNDVPQRQHCRRTMPNAAEYSPAVAWDFFRTVATGCRAIAKCGRRWSNVELGSCWRRASMPHMTADRTAGAPGGRE